MPIITLEEEFGRQADDLAWMDGLEKEFRKGWELEKATYSARQRMARKEVDSAPIKNIDGLGQLTAVIDARTYFRWQEQDQDFWSDDGNVKKFLKDNPECRAPKPVAPTRITV